MRVRSVSALTLTEAWRTFVFVRLETDEGIVGWGEAGCVGHERALVAAIGELGEALVGADPAPIARLCAGLHRRGLGAAGPVLTGAVSGIEQALWDVKGKTLGAPVYDLLGGRCRDDVRAYTWIHGDTPDALAEAALRRREEGWRAVKFMPVDRIEPALDLPQLRLGEAKVRAVRAAVGEDFGLAVDGYCLLSAPNALELARRIEPYGLMFFEEPLPPDDPEALAELRRATRVPIATGERVAGRHAFRALLERRAVDVVQPDVSTGGGLLECRLVAATAELFSAALAPHNPFSGLATVVSLHLAALAPNFLILEVAVSPGRARVLAAGAPELRDGCLRPPTGPGWGVEVDEPYLQARSA
jgi:galactonate dehydratase